MNKPPSYLSQLMFKPLFILYALFGQYAVKVFSGPDSPNTYYTLIHSKAMVLPDNHFDDDLLIISGRRLPYFFNRLASLLYRMNLPVEFLWSLLFVALKIAFWVSLWFLSYSVTGDPAVAALATMACYFSHMHAYSLHWTPVKPLAPYHGMFALPFGYVALALVLQGNFLMAALMATIAFGIHATIGAIACASVAVATLIGSNSFIVFGYSVLIISAVALPVLFKVFSLARQKQTAGGDLLPVFRTMMGHYFPERHLHEGYGTFGLMLFGCALLSPYYMEFIYRKDMFIVVLLSLLALPIISVINLFTLKSLTLIQAYLFRATVFIKPLCFSVITLGLVNVARAKGVFESIDSFSLIAVTSVIMLMLSLNMITSFTTQEGRYNLMKAELLALCGWTGLSFYILDSWSEIILTIIIAGPVCVFASIRVLTYLSKESGMELFILSNLIKRGEDGTIDRLRLLNLFNLFFGVSCAVLVILSSQNATSPASLMAGNMDVQILLYMFALFIIIRMAQDRICNRDITSPQYASSAPEVLGLFRWARLETTPGSKFVVDPGDNRMIVFRYFTERQIQFHRMDLSALNYDHTVFLEGYKRLRDLGVDYKKSRLMKNELINMYYSKNSEEWERFSQENRIDYIVFDKSQAQETISRPIAYEDNTFIVYHMNTKL